MSAAAARAAATSECAPLNSTFDESTRSPSSADLAAELHPTRDGEVDPFTLGAWVSRPMWWLCPACGHEWRTSPGNRNGADGSGCPACARRQVPYERSLAAVRRDLAGELRDLDPATIAASSHQPVWWRCSDCGREWRQPPAGRGPPPDGAGCRSCRARRQWSPRPRDERGRLLPASAPSTPAPTVGQSRRAARSARRELHQTTALNPPHPRRPPAPANPSPRRALVA